MSVVIDGTSGITFPDASSQSAAAPSGYPAQAWVNFNGTGTVAIRDDGNVSSLTDNGTGNYRVGLSNAVSASTYALAVGNASYSATQVSRQTSQKSHYSSGPVNRTTTYFELLQGITSNAGLQDHAEVVAVAVR